ncbi:MAG: hypothetical protein OK457_06745 [Thaumarchaeota archaeon]|nr:hypothetical protein [Nitrososphaerota archaeon]
MQFKRKLKKRCKRGHLFTEKNTRIDKQNARVCLKCRRMHSIARSKNPGIGSGGPNRIKIRCVNGHPFSKENTYVIKRDGKSVRHCISCSRRQCAEHRQRRKKRVFKAYGGKCSWLGCNITDVDMLTLDHVNDDGSEERIRGFTGGDVIYKKAEEENYPDRYQILCANHNLKKQIEKLRAKRIQS